jgi:hypothetical protein
MTTKRTLVQELAELQLSFDVGHCSKVEMYALCDPDVRCDQAK